MGTATQDFLLGRQQIVDRQLNVFGYELLFRDLHGRAPEQTEGTAASNQVIVNSLLEEGLEGIVGRHRAFINFTRENILSGTVLLLPKEKVVVELLETVEADDAVVAAVESIARQGYMIALDDFIYTEERLPLVRVADIIKLDVHQVSPDLGRHYMSLLSRFRPKFLAEKVETREQYDAFFGMGCHYFQGFLFSRPNIVRGRRVSAGQHATLRLLAEINRPDIEPRDLAQTISLDVGLSYKLLRYINHSALFRLPTKVDSIHRAVVYLGLREVRRWANLVCLASFPDTPREVVMLSLTRAKMCELLGQAAGAQAAEQFFLTGLMSMLDQMMGVPLDQVLGGLPLAEEVSRALLFREGRLGDALRCAVDYESWNLDKIGFANVPIAEIGHTYVDSLSWANEVTASISAIEEK